MEGGIPRMDVLESDGWGREKSSDSQKTSIRYTPRDKLFNI